MQAVRQSKKVSTVSINPLEQSLTPQCTDKAMEAKQTAVGKLAEMKESIPWSGAKLTLRLQQGITGERPTEKSREPIRISQS